MGLHVVHFMRCINPDTLAGLQNVCLLAVQQGATEIRIHMSSEGGTTDHGFAAYHFLRSLPVTLAMHCIGNIESMAVVMFLAGNNRAIVPHGKIKIHPMHWGFPSGTVDHDRLAEYVDSLDFDADRYASIFEERTAGAQIPVDARAHLAGKAKLLNAQSAIESGIVTSISEVELDASSVKWWV